jgi:hypothetical protein
MSASQDQLMKLVNSYGSSVQIEMVDRLPQIALSQNSFHRVSSLLSNNVNHVPLLPIFYKIMKNGKIFEFSQQCFKNSSEGVTQHSLNSSLILNGFTNIEIISISDSEVLVKCTTPEWKNESNGKLSFGKKKITNQPIVIQNNSIWTIDASLDDQDLIDEGLLLDDEDLIIPPTSAPGDCSTKKKACKDCSCGRAEEEMMQDLNISKNVVVVTNKASSCGSCYLGDGIYLFLIIAFRCGTCPYLGMPAFKPGELVKIGMTDDL